MNLMELKTNKATATLKDGTAIELTKMGPENLVCTGYKSKNQATTEGVENLEFVGS